MGPGAERAGGAPGSTSAAAGRGRRLPPRAALLAQLVSRQRAGAGAAARRGDGAAAGACGEHACGRAAAAGADGDGADHGGRGRAGSRAGAASGRSSRRAPPASDVASVLETPGAVELVAALQELGAQTVEVMSCDVSDRDAVSAVFEQHSGGSAVDGCVPPCGGAGRRDCSGADRGAAGACLRPKLDGAYHLHELTADQELAAFVLFSSAAGLGGAGRRTTRRPMCSWMRCGGAPEAGPRWAEPEGGPGSRTS